MSYQTITFNVVDGVATLALNRPEVLNGLTAGMRAEIRDAVLDAPNHGRVLVITGNGRAFCSGQDLGGSTAMTDLDLGIALRWCLTI